MDKQFLVEQLASRLRESVQVARKAGEAAAEEARAGATPAEKREDARVAMDYAGLARGQKDRAARTAAELTLLESFRPRPLAGERPHRARGGRGSRGRLTRTHVLPGPGRRRRRAPRPRRRRLPLRGHARLAVGKAVIGERVGDTVEVLVQGEPREWAITYVG